MAFFFWYGIRDRSRTHLNANRLAPTGAVQASNRRKAAALSESQSYIVHYNNHKLKLALWRLIGSLHRAFSFTSRRAAPMLG
jgi:hypothetical protein